MMLKCFHEGEHCPVKDTILLILEITIFNNETDEVKLDQSQLWDVPVVIPNDLLGDALVQPEHTPEDVALLLGVKVFDRFPACLDQGLF